MLAPFAGTLLLTQLFGSMRGGPSERYTAWREGKQITCIAHPALDINAATGTPLVAVKPGIVRATLGDPFFGNYLVITDVAGGTYTYAHLSRIDVANGARVNGGEHLGLSGATGNVTGPHLHFAVRDPHINYANGFDGYIDPLPRFDADVYPHFDMSLV